MQAHPSLVVTLAGAAVNAAPITGYLTLVLSDVTDSTFVMDTIPGNAVRTPPSTASVRACLPAAACAQGKTWCRACESHAHCPALGLLGPRRHLPNQRK